jgi:hypothetical protein
MSRLRGRSRYIPLPCRIGPTGYCVDRFVSQRQERVGAPIWRTVLKHD